MVMRKLVIVSHLYYLCWYSLRAAELDVKARVSSIFEGHLFRIIYVVTLPASGFPVAAAMLPPGRGLETERPRQVVPRSSWSVRERNARSMHRPIRRILSGCI